MGSGRYPEVSAPADGGDITAGSVPLAALADLAASTVIGRNTQSTGVPEAVTMAQLAALLGQGGTAAADLRVPVTFISDELDAMTTGARTFGGNWPAITGWKFIRGIGWFVLTNVAATTFATGVVGLTAEIGTAGNLIPSTNQPSSALMNGALAAGGGGPYIITAQSTPSAALKVPELTATPTVTITTAPTGTAITQAKFKIVLHGVLVPNALLATV